MSELECPYCNCEVEQNEDREPGVLHEKECPHCGKNFVYSIEYYPSFTASAAPCLNGGEHDYQPIAGIPAEYFENKRRCSYCDREVEVSAG